MRGLSLLLLALVSASALAQEGHGAYIGITYARLHYKDSFRYIDFGDTLSTYRLTGGFRFRENLAFEAYYSSDESFSSTQYGVLGGTDPGPFTADFTGDIDVKEIRLVMRKNWFMAGVGLYAANVHGSVALATQIGPMGGSISDSDSGYALTFGAQFDFKRVGIRTEYEYFDVSSPAGLYSFGVGFLYGFK